MVNGGSDLQMVPQALGITQNGLGYGHPLSGPREQESG